MQNKIPFILIPMLLFNVINKKGTSKKLSQKYFNSYDTVLQKESYEQKDTYFHCTPMF